MQRRVFMQGVAGALLAPAVGHAFGRGSASATATRAPLVLVDMDLPGSEAFACRARARGLAVRTMPAGDLGPLWLNELRPRWRTSRAPVIGLSRQLTLFQLEQLAWDERWRVSTRVQHLRTASGRYIHKLAAATGQPRIMLRGATMLPGSDSQWGAAALDLMLSGSRAGQRGLPEPLGPWRGSADDNLFSWLIEARPRAALI